MRFAMVLLELTLLASACKVRMIAQTESQPIAIGSIDYFGYGELDLKKLDGHLPLHVGQTVTEAGLNQTRIGVREAIVAVMGAPPTDINATCCDANKHLMIYLGLAGNTSRPLTRKVAPIGAEHLDSSMPKLYDSFRSVLEAAISRGATREDWSKGYALSEDAATRAIQMQAREYAPPHEEEIERTLRNAADLKQRIASAWLLGYSNRSATQIQTLADTATDSDGEVRNNAVRALSVLSAAKDAPPLTLDAKPLIAMLYSGQWTDRNKASLLFQMLTENRNPAILNQLRREAMPALIEGARWTSLGHAQAFLVILGRIGKLPDADIEQFMHADRERLIEAAKHSVGCCTVLANH